MSSRLNITKESLIDFYISQKLSAYKIAYKYNCDPKTIYYWLKTYKVPTRARKIIPISKFRLIQLYKTGMSLKAIANTYQCNTTSIFNKFKKYHIKTRTSWESNIIHKRSNFSEDLQEKAYLIGFRIGDLNVVQKSHKSFIRVKSSTTKDDQIKLMKAIFSRYGPIWIGKSTNRPNVYHFDTSLNGSFAFLLPKYKSIPKWILKSKTIFLCFFAGYTDAEGSAGVYNNRGIFRIGSYDYIILKQIHEYLNKLGIKNSLLLETKAGIYGLEKHNGDFYRVYIREKYALNECLSLLLPYLKHKNRIKCVNDVLKNVRSRM